MKRFGVILLLGFAMIAMASASIEVNNYSFQTSYFPFQPIVGWINLSIEGENFDTPLNSSSGDSISLGDFLQDNGVIYQCSPPDCSIDYNAQASSSSKTFSFGASPVYVGFVLEGENVRVSGLNFNIQSNFNSSILAPLYIDFFESGKWKFQEFSDVNFSQQDWGCYNSNVRTVGPLIGISSYCEMITLTETNAVYAGADVSGTDNKNLTMVLYPEIGGTPFGNCKYNPNTYPGCRIQADLGEIFEEGKYMVCVQAESATNYKIYQETDGPKCGFVYSNGPENSTKDYSISARTAHYAGAGYFSPADLDFEELVSAADELLVEKYGRDCSDKCILPMAFFGLSQSMNISSISLDYTVNGEFYQSNEISSLQSIPATVDFEGVLDFSLTGFNISDEESYSLYLGGEELFEEEIEMIPAPVITSLSPKNPPARVPVTFYVGVDFDNPNASLTYYWQFENGTQETTNVNSVVHTFPEIKNYSVIVKVNAGGNLTSQKGFVIETISPLEAVNVTLSNMRDNLDKVESDIQGFPEWYRDELEEIINYSYYDGELTRLEREYGLAYDDSNILDVATELFSLNFPTEVFVKEEAGYSTLTQGEDIDPQIILDFAGGSLSSNIDSYIDPILRWQTQSIQSDVSTKTISVAWLDGTIEPIFRTYRYNIISYADDDGYLIIKKPFFELFFKDNVGASKAGDDDTVVIIDAGGSKIFEFYYTSAEETPFFISPKLSRLVIVEDIDTTCNYNLICEPDEGENSSTCRSDCKPTSRMILYIILAVLFVLIIYTFIQIWYKDNYESHLFGDRRQLYNLLMYIANARARGKEDGEIRKDLVKQGWSSERLTYVFRKSSGKSTGMFEIIPISKISAALRNRSARRRVATEPQQQFGGNINKSGFQRRPIR